MGDWAFLDNIVARFSYGKGFRMPSLKEIYFNFVDINHNIFGNPKLQSETSNTFALHLNSNVGTYHALNWKLFYNQIQNFITLIPNENSSNFEYDNIGYYRLLGGKLGLDSKFANSHCSFDFSYLTNYLLMVDTQERQLFLNLYFHNFYIQIYNNLIINFFHFHQLKHVELYV